MQKPNQTLMFFFGAFAGNFMYLMLAVFYMAGFSVWFIKGNKDTIDEKCQSVDSRMTISIDNQVPDQVLSDSYHVGPHDFSVAIPSPNLPRIQPVLPHRLLLWASPPTLKPFLSHVTTLFSRPPPSSDLMA